MLRWHHGWAKAALVNAGWALGEGKREIITGQKVGMTAEGLASTSRAWARQARTSLATAKWEIACLREGGVEI